MQSLGFAFATTSYRRNGLAILEGVQDVRELVAASRPLPTYVTGVSEGGLIATLLAERWPELFVSALATCGPIGSFRAQLDSFGDFRVLFDYFFPGLLPGSAVEIPPQLMANWPAYVPQILGALAAHPDRALELMRVSRAAYDPANPATIGNTTINMLWYNVFATNDAVARLGGNPFGNRLRSLLGSSNRFHLNLSVRRFSASPVARASLREYETSGDLQIPLVTLHTTADGGPLLARAPVSAKLDLSGRGRFVALRSSATGTATSPQAK